MTTREKLIKKAFELLNGTVNTSPIITKADGTARYIPKTSKGYISSLGGSIVQAGLLQSVIFFEEKEEGRKDIIKALLKMIKHQFPSRYSAYPDENLSQWLSTNRNQWDRQRLTKDMGEAAIALKMAMRMFEFK